MRTEVYELNGKQIRIPIAESYKDCMTLIRSDRYRRYGKKESTLSIILQSLKPYSSSVLFWLRLCQYKGWLYPFCKIMCARAKRKTLVALPTRTKIGYGFTIGAQGGMCIAINGGTIIGNNVGVSQFVNIGTNSSTYSIIGDGVYIGPHTCIVEGIKIGNNATIGAGAIVTRDVPENATAVGVPAKVINYDNPGRFIGRRWPISESD